MDDGKLTENEKYNRKEVVRLKINIFQFNNNYSINRIKTKIYKRLSSS
jgi:hypothetical protein